MEFKKVAIADWLLQCNMQYAHARKLKPPLHKKSRSAPGEGGREGGREGIYLREEGGYEGKGERMRERGREGGRKERGTGRGGRERRRGVGSWDGI